MNISTRILSKFTSGLVDYREYLELLDSKQLSEELVKDMPFSVFEVLMSSAEPNVFEQLDLRDKLRDWGEKYEKTSEQFAEAKVNAFKYVKQNILTAFSNTSLGEGTTLAEANAIDSYKTTEEQCLARQLDENIAWQDYPVQDLENLTSLMFLNAEGFKYYIPAYLLWCIDNCLSDPFSNIASQAFDAFDPELSSYQTRIQALNSLQKESIKSFLWLFAIYSDIYRDTCIAGLQALGTIDFSTEKL